MKKETLTETERDELIKIGRSRAGKAYENVPYNTLEKHLLERGLVTREANVGNFSHYQITEAGRKALDS